MATHKLKTHPEPFQAVWEGRKPFEWRADDREPRYEVGDYLHLREYDPEAPFVFEEARYTGRMIAARVTHISRGSFGIPEGYAVLGLDRDIARYPRD